ncbi:hypothetical protein DFH09DRAFT_1185228 [Mycena vulgaris]|nr:hypothetical protein DFH09DRAFT_1185228 [Mycena vulgaris]
MPLRLVQRNAAEELAQKIFKWEIISEEHAAVLRSDPNQLAEVYARCEVNTPPIGSFPPRDQLASCIATAELGLQSTATTFPERLKAISSCLFLCRPTMMLAAEDDYAVYLEMKAKRSALHNQHPYDTSQTTLPSQLHPLLANSLAPPRRPISTPAANDHPLQYPIGLLGRMSFTFDEIGNAARVQVTGAAIAEYRRNPDRLPEEKFVSESPEGLEAFKVSSILSTENQDNFFYLVCFYHSSDNFFALLSTSARLLLT